jgi:hypothetical protein
MSEGFYISFIGLLTRRYIEQTPDREEWFDEQKKSDTKNVMTITLTVFYVNFPIRSTVSYLSWGGGGGTAPLGENSSN